MSDTTRRERDTLGTVELPRDALYGAQTQRAAENFQISTLRLPASFLNALASIKEAAAHTNTRLDLIAAPIGAAISRAAAAISAGQYHEQFIVDVFQTGSGTSTNMNMNEVLARLASSESGVAVHPNDHVNCCQSSNDVIPSALRISTVGALDRQLFAAIDALAATIERKADEYPNLVKTARTHLMDAVPMRVADELGGWVAQLRQARERLASARLAMLELPLGGTAVGSGVNAHPEFAERAVARLATQLDAPFVVSRNRFGDLSAQDGPLAVSAQLRGLATVLLKIANDLRWMNSGPVAGLAEVRLAPLQPGSSIMPGKVNPVIAEAVAMIAAQVIGNDATISVAAQSGNFQLNVMQPLVAHALLQSIDLLAAGCHHLAEKCVAQMQYNEDHLHAGLSRNPMLATALAPLIGYELAAEIAKLAATSDRPVIEIAAERCSLSRAELERALDPLRMARGGLI